ncbi:MAG: carboxylating nicotinate-nucleotide diphosphorylase [Planctomycetota bacterium]
MCALDLVALRPLLLAALREDVGPGDRTTGLLVPPGARGVARIQAGEPGVLAGIGVALEVLRLSCGEQSVVRSSREDGVEVSPGDGVGEVEGPARGLLSGERTALNFLMRMSGIATLTARFVQAVAGTGASILDTRKTAPGLRALDKAAVRMGGGHNHRFALYDAVLVKENHLAFHTDLARALRDRPEGVALTVEAESVEEFRIAMEGGADVVLLDGLGPEDVARARALRGGRERPALEVSGGITLRNVRAYAEAGAERISVGALTHSAPALDLSMRIAATGA